MPRPSRNLTRQDNEALAPLVKRMQRDMVGAVRDLMGGGYVPDYYRDLASDFAWVAEAFMQDAYKLGTENPTAFHPADAVL